MPTFRELIRIGVDKNGVDIFATKADEAKVLAREKAEKQAAAAKLKNETQDARVEKRKKEQREGGKLRKPNLERDEDGILKAVSQGIDDANTDAKRKK